MAFVSWAYDHADVETITYDGETVAIDLASHPSIIRQVAARVQELT